MTIKFEVKNRFSGDMQFVADISCEDGGSFCFKLGLAVKWAIENKANLRYADLIGANLGGANLRGADLMCADLSGANLMCANLMCANLGGADLSDADLRYANLRGADLMCADLMCADLSGADLTSADLTSADLTSADLTSANLRGANLSKKQLRNYKHDFWGILLQYKNEIPALRKLIVDGKIDGSVYSGECSCLMGTISNIKNCDLEDMEKDSSSYIESWFMMIKIGDTPENNNASKKALEWLDEFTMLLNIKE